MRLSLRKALKKETEVGGEVLNTNPEKKIYISRSCLGIKHPKL